MSFHRLTIIIITDLLDLLEITIYLNFPRTRILDLIAI